MKHAHTFGTPCHSRCPRFGTMATPADWFTTTTTRTDTAPADPTGDAPHDAADAINAGTL